MITTLIIPLKNYKMEFLRRMKLKNYPNRTDCAVLQIGQKIPLTIKRLGINGEGIGYFKHKLVFVAQALPE